MQPEAPVILTLDEVRHIAKLARLSFNQEQLEQYRTQLAAILEHVRTLQRLDVSQVEPMAHPMDMTNRLDDDTVGPALTIEQVLQNAPATEGRYLAVPKVLAEQEG